MPAEDEIRAQLRRQGLTPAQIERILFQYHQATLTLGASAWTDTKLQEWIGTQVRTFAGAGSSNPSQSVMSGVDERSDEGERQFAAVQSLAREMSAQRRQRVQDEFYRNVRIDYGPVMDPDSLANSLGSGAWVDAEGNYIDPSTGKPTDEPIQANGESIWHAIKGQRFRMGALAMPGGATLEQQRSPSYYPHGTSYRGAAVAHPSADTMERTGRRDRTVIPRGVAPTKPRSFVTPSQALGLLSSLDEDNLTQLQHQLYEAGLYPEDTRPRWGHPDTPTREAFKKLFIEASLDPTKTVAAILSDLALDRRDMLAPPEGSPGAGGAGLPALVLPDFEPAVANEEELRQSIDDIASETIGQFLPKDQREALIGKLREREIGLQRQQYDRDVQRAREQHGAQVAGLQVGGQGGGGSMADVDAFMAALSGQESGGDYGAVNRGSGAQGKYQIMPANWPEWSRRAGIPGAPRTPQNQEIVARQIIMDYFAQFGNWRDVAVAWYSGPGNVAGKRNSTRAQRGGPSISAYADQVMGRMGQVRRSGAAAGGAAGGAMTVGGREFAPIEAFDPNAEIEAALKAADPAGWEATEWASRATEWFGALASPIQVG